MYNLSQAELREVLDYDSVTGHFHWRHRGGKFRKDLVGTRAGADRGPGDYRNITVFGCSYLEHREAWFYVYGEWPAHLDHVNREKGDNRIANLREATRAQNRMNQGTTRRNTSGFIGVRFHNISRLWQAYITVAGKFRSLGYFKTPAEASKAREVASTAAHGEYHHGANHAIMAQ